MELEDIKKSYGGNGKYFYQAMRNHILGHGMTLEDYFEKISDRPICKCGICGKPTRISTKKDNKSGFFWSEYACGRYPGSLEAYEKAKESRKGNGNPMYGKVPWNFGLTKDTNESMRSISEKQKGKITSGHTKTKQSLSAKKRTVHGHTGCRHTEAAKEKMRTNTLKMIKEGRFKQTKTAPHIRFQQLLEDVGLDYEEEKIIKCWSFDFYIPKYDLYVEIDGDYFHSNPSIYPSGPVTKIQKINYYRDMKKNSFALASGMKLIRIWESEVLTSPEVCLNRIYKYEI